MAIQLLLGLVIFRLAERLNAAFLLPALPRKGELPHTLSMQYLLNIREDGGTFAVHLGSGAIPGSAAFLRFGIETFCSPANNPLPKRFG